ncbi:unnamed protein product [Symbiodinium sp. CCMP2592]|nr:unnamed protein product [Symbiodinium sp. CCMP2592]
MRANSMDARVAIEMYDDQVMEVAVNGAWWSTLNQQEQLVFAVKCQEAYRKAKTEDSAGDGVMQLPISFCDCLPEPLVADDAAAGENDKAEGSKKKKKKNKRKAKGEKQDDEAKTSASSLGSLDSMD